MAHGLVKAILETRKEGEREGGQGGRGKKGRKGRRKEKKKDKEKAHFSNIPDQQSKQNFVLD